MTKVQDGESLPRGLRPFGGRLSRPPVFAIDGAETLTPQHLVPERRLGGLVTPGDQERIWRLCFMAGLPLGALIYQSLAPDPLPFRSGFSWLVLVLAGFLVGFGTRLGSGCTSGHGICGLSRLSARSLVATLVFMAFGVATATLVRHGAGLS